jgi:hypothetical protein
MRAQPDNADGQADIAKKKKEVGVRTLEVKSRQKASQTAELELREWIGFFARVTLRRRTT